MRALLRYLVLFGGIVLMINGCDGVVSSRFGTLEQSTIDLTDTDVNIGDDDYVKVTNAVFTPVTIDVQSAVFWSADVRQSALLTGAQLSAWKNGERVRPQIIAWLKSPASTSAPISLNQFTKSNTAEGVIGHSTTTDAAAWAKQRFVIDESTHYLHLNQQPARWYWSLAMFLGGLTIAALPDLLNL
ncbi:hypothetical protein [Neolewinella antarctica]|uniref:Uncharacterized protein n=1 Tax=Neolewinella antarctica TaxID=442734 RepID=A0ABX0X7N4_9BACT|nr:hypothetical protein [Neolewinella antarctica]NJC25011.1 hypothetical protein [Neolewinella antarctica]